MENYNKIIGYVLLAIGILLIILPIDLINNTLNLACWLLLMWILIYGGGKIADIGVKLLNGNK